VEACVIGGGYTGLSAALHLAERGVRVVLLESGRVGGGASGRNGGQLGSGQRRGQKGIEADYGSRHAADLWRVAEQAKRTVLGLIERHAIACDVVPGILTAAHKPSTLAALLDEAEHLETAYGYDKLEAVSGQAMPGTIESDLYCGGVIDWGAATLHPLKLALGLARVARDAGAVLYERSPVTSVERGSPAVIRTARAEIEADTVVFAGGAYSNGLVPEFDRRLVPVSGRILATEPLGERAKALMPRVAAAEDSFFILNYFRLDAEGRLLFGGGGRLGPHGVQDLASTRKAMLRVFPQLADIQIEASWTGWLAITLRQLPHVGRLSPNSRFAYGYTGHGVALGVECGRLLAEDTLGASPGFEAMSRIGATAIPGGRAIAGGLTALAYLYGNLRDRF
jgi:gamma-glutamylputrescine oxidase